MKAQRSELAQDHTLGMTNQPRIWLQNLYLLHCLQGEGNWVFLRVEQRKLGNGQCWMVSRAWDAEGVRPVHLKGDPPAVAVTL